MNNTNLRKVSIEVELKLQDLYRFHCSMIYRNVIVQFFLAMTVFGIILMPFNIGDSSFYFKDLRTVIFRVIIPLLIISLPLLIYIYTKVHLNRIDTKLQYFVSNYGFTIEGKKIATIPWKNIFKVEETKRHFTVFITKDVAYLIPKIFFKSNEEISVFKEILLEYMDSSKLEIKK